MRVLRSSFWLFVVVVSLSSFAAVGQAQSLTAELPRDPALKFGTLPNGLTYYIRRNPNPEHRVELRLAVKAGSILEDPDQQGLAHFTEHMAFNGTKKWPKNDLINFLESSGVRFGAHLNAYTSFDETVYMLQLPTDKPDEIHNGLDVLSEWASGLLFDPVEIDKERGVVVEEWRLGRGANERIGNRQLPILLNGSRYADRITIGKKEVLDTFQYATVKRFYHDWYRPDLMAVVIVGDIDPDDMLAQVTKLFAPLANPSPERPRTEYTIQPHAETLVSIETDPELTSPSFDLYFLKPQKTEKTVADYREDIIASLCDIMFGRRCQELAMSSDPPFTSGGASERHFLDETQAFTVTAGLKEDSLMAGVAAILREAYRTKEQGFTAGELERAKSQVMTQMENLYNGRAKSQSANFVREYVSNFLKGESIPGIEYEHEIYEKYMPSISLQEINAHASERMENASVVLTLEASRSDSIHVPTRSELLSLFEKIRAEHEQAYVDKRVDEPLIGSEPTPGKIISEKKLPSIGVTEWVLSNGAHVVLKPTDFQADEIKFQAVGWGGTSVASPDELVSAQMAAPVLLQGGLGNLDYASLENKLAGKSAGARPYVTSLAQGISGGSSKKDMETMFQLIYLDFTAPRLDSNATHSYLSRLSSFLETRGRNPQTAFDDTAAATMSQYSLRAKPLSLERLREFDPKRAYEFYRSRFRYGNNFTFFFVGSFKPDSLRTFVEKYIASLPRTPATADHATFRDDGVRYPTGTIVKHVYKGIEQKSSVRINISGPFAWSLKERFEITELAEVLSIKLREDLREDKSGVYGISVRAAPERYPYAHYTFSISFGCAPERVDELVAEVMKQLDTAQMRPFDTVYIHKVKEIQRNEFETGIKGNEFWLTALTTDHTMNEDPVQILARKEMIDGLTADDVLQSARKYLDRKNMVEVVLYPEKKTKE